jgi:hypothetical protein
MVQSALAVIPSHIGVKRLLDRAIIGPSAHESIGVNIQGPSLIRVPDWIADRLGRYYLYFADHKGSYIRHAYADHLEGPWAVHPPGSLHLKDSCFLTEPPAVTAEQLARFEARAARSGARLSHDVLSEITTLPFTRLGTSPRGLVATKSAVPPFTMSIIRVSKPTDFSRRAIFTFWA